MRAFGLFARCVMCDTAADMNKSAGTKAKALYALLASYADDDRNVQGVARRDLAAALGCSVSTIDRTTEVLAGIGLLRVTRNTCPDDPSRNLPNLYELHDAWLIVGRQPPDGVPLRLVERYGQVAQFAPTLPAPVKVPRPRRTSNTRRRTPITKEKRARVLERDGHRCLLCGTADDLTMDHIEHWSRGGTNQETNLRTLCRSCNSKRQAGSLPGLDH